MIIDPKRWSKKNFFWLSSKKISIGQHRGGGMRAHSPIKFQKVFPKNVKSEKPLVENYGKLYEK